MPECPICTDNAAADNGTDPWLIARLHTGYVRLAPNQYFRGSVFFVARQCVREVFELDASVRGRHLEEMADVAAAVNDAFETPRYETDPRARGPIWEDLDFLRALWGEGGRPSPEERAALRDSLLRALRSRDVLIELTHSDSERSTQSSLAEDERNHLLQ
jgi:diadenosine tetraphosphate (Ap4A) HIT family hydrolase